MSVGLTDLLQIGQATMARLPFRPSNLGHPEFVRGNVVTRLGVQYACNLGWGGISAFFGHTVFMVYVEKQLWASIELSLDNDNHSPLMLCTWYMSICTCLSFIWTSMLLFDVKCTSSRLGPAIAKLTDPPLQHMT